MNAHLETLKKLHNLRIKQIASLLCKEVASSVIEIEHGFNLIELEFIKTAYLLRRQRNLG